MGATAVGAVTPQIAITFAGATNIAAEVTTGNANLASILPALSAKTAAGTSTVAGAANTITIGFTCNTALASGDTVTVSGLTNLGDADSNAIVLTGTDAALFTSNSVASRGDWTLSTGTIVLTANQAVSASAKEVSFAMTNKATAVGAVTPQIAITIAGTSNIAAAATTGNANLASVLPAAALSAKT